MKDDKQTTRQFVQKNFFTIISVVVVILNLWLFSKLAPIISDIKTLVIRVDAQGEQLKEHKSTSDATIGRIDSSLTKISDSINNVNSRLSRIEGKLE